MAKAIRVDGLKEFGQSLKKLDGDLPRVSQLASNESADMVAAGAKPLFPVMRGRARGSVEAAGPEVTAGGGRAPHALWLDFGGSVGRRGSVKRPHRRSGRYILPTHRRLEAAGEYEAIMGDQLAAEARRAGIEVDD